MTSQYLLAFMVEPLSDEPFSVWPLHITLMPWFSAEDEAELTKSLQQDIAKLRVIEVKIGRKTWFGYDLPVRLIEPKTELRRLHNALLIAVKRAGGELRAKTYTGVKYAPHITVRGQRTIEGGHKLIIATLALIKNLSDQPQLRQKVAEFHLKV